MAQSLLIQYTNLLRQYRDPDAQPVKQFVAQHAGDKVFVQRVKALNKVYRLKEQLVTAR